MGGETARGCVQEGSSLAAENLRSRLVRCIGCLASQVGNDLVGGAPPWSLSGQPCLHTHEAKRLCRESLGRHTPVRTHCGCTWGLGVVTDLTGIGAHRCAVRYGARPGKTVKACKAKTVGSWWVANMYDLGCACPSWIATDCVPGRSRFYGMVARPWLGLWVCSGASGCPSRTVLPTD